MCVFLCMCVCKWVRSVSVGVCMRLMKSGIGELLRGQPLRWFENGVLLVYVQGKMGMFMFVCLCFPFYHYQLSFICCLPLQAHMSAAYTLFWETPECSRVPALSSTGCFFCFFLERSVLQSGFPAFSDCLVKQRGTAVSQRRCLNVHVHCCTAGRLSPSKSAKRPGSPLAETVRLFIC